MIGKRRRSRLTAPVLLSTAALLAVSACGSGPGGSGSGAGNGSPIHFALVAPLTGTYAENGAPILQGAKAAVKILNDAGGVLGHKVVMDQVDTVGDAADAVPAVNREIGVNHPVFLDGPITLSIHAVQPIFDKNHIVDGWNGGDTHFDKQTDKWLWRCNASDSELGVALAKEAWDKGYKTAVVFMSESASTQTLTPVIENAYKALGGKILATVSVVPAQSSYRTEVQNAVSYHPDVFLTQMEPSTASVAMADFKEVDNLSIPFVGTDLTAGSDFIKAIGPAVAKAHFISVQGSNALTAAGPAFVAAYQAVNGRAPLGGAAFSYDCAIDFALAMTKANSTDPNVWIKSIKDVSNPPGISVSDYKTGVADIRAGKKINYEGASGPMDFNQYHNVAGAWDVVVSNGDAAGDVTTLRTISANEIQAVINKEGGR
ncbi:MAG: ABC transporter substrate-binding protein [Candidatus Dormibacteraceae bacterium]